MTIDKGLLKKISEEFAKGNLEFSAVYMADDIKWNILGNETILGKDQVLEVAKMLQLESFPVIKINNVFGEGDYVVVESKGEAKTRNGSPTTRRIAMSSALPVRNFKKSILIWTLH